MPPRNQAGKRGKTGGSSNTTQSDVQEFQRQQKEFLKFENRNTLIEFGLDITYHGVFTKSIKF